MQFVRLQHLNKLMQAYKDFKPVLFHNRKELIITNYFVINKSNCVLKNRVNNVSLYACERSHKESIP